jgi:UDP-N-acetylglucosamine--N-acetylmuramyl-(pentapeptide) pyrophosphoryl-undecaprenol N-acetylglucosamine transferase
MDASITHPSYRQFEFVSEELPDYLALSDLIISRAGSNAIHEFLALKKPMLLIPLPLSASRGDQILNAQSFEARGFARVLSEEDVTEETLLSAIHQVRDGSAAMRAAMENAENSDGTETICKMILKEAGIE